MSPVFIFLLAAIAFDCINPVAGRFYRLVKRKLFLIRRKAVNRRTGPLLSSLINCG
jgi:hypothetical protein